MKRKVLLLILACSVGLFLLLYFYLNRNSEAVVEMKKHSRPSPPQVDPGAFQLQAEWRKSLVRAADKLGAKETLTRVLERLGMPKKEYFLATQAAAEVADLTKIRPGSEVVYYKRADTGEAVRIEYTRPGIPALVIIKTPSGWVAAWQEYKTIVNLVAAKGAITSSLWEDAVQRQKLDPNVVLSMSDAFAYDIDFFADIQPGDVFKVLYEQRFCQGESLGCGRVLAAKFINKGVTFEAFYYEDAKGNSGYYDAAGRSLKKMFLKSPLNYTRITSHFSYARMHPILKRITTHLGVDYAAPIGTPVSALGSGQVVFQGWGGGYGNLVTIKHNKSYTTMYGHLSGFAKGLKVGSRVKQGDVIGYVGSTGLSTGPHLDFRVNKDGKFMDPLSLKAEPAPPLDQAEKQKFTALLEVRRAEQSRLLAAVK